MINSSDPALTAVCTEFATPDGSIVEAVEDLASRSFAGD
jgi:hypothetical protein